MKVVYEIFDFWRPQGFDFFHEPAHNRTTHKHLHDDINRTHAGELQQELRQCDALRAHSVSEKRRQ